MIDDTASAKDTAEMFPDIKRKLTKHLPAEEKASHRER